MEAVLSYWHARSHNEQRGIIITTVVLLLCLLYFGILNPLIMRANKAEQSLKNERQLSSWVANKVAQIQSLQQEGGDSSSSSMPLNQAVTSSTRRYQIEIVRLQPQQDELQVWIQPLSFNTLLKWLDELNKRYGVSVKFIEIGKGDSSGMVEIKRLQLGRG